MIVFHVANEYTQPTALARTKKNRFLYRGLNHNGFSCVIFFHETDSSGCKQH